MNQSPQKLEATRLLFIMNEVKNSWTIEKRKEYNKRYFQIHKKQLNEKKKQYRQTHKKQIKEENKRYFHSFNGQNICKKCKSKYFQSPKGKEAIKRHHAKRRKFSFIPLNKFFDGCDGHHIDKKRIVYIPRELHRSIWHSILSNINMNKINKLAFKYLETENFIESQDKQVD